MINTYNRYLVGLLLILLGSTLPITAQSDFEFPPDPGNPTTLLSYNVSVGINDTQMGYVSGAGKFKYGRRITIGTSAQSGYRFVKWQKDGVDYSTYTSFSYTVTGDVTFNVTSVSLENSVTFNVDSGKTINLSPVAFASGSSIVKTGDGSVILPTTAPTATISAGKLALSAATYGLAAVTFRSDAIIDLTAMGARIDSADASIEAATFAATIPATAGTDVLYSTNPAILQYAKSDLDASVPVGFDLVITGEALSVEAETAGSFTGSGDICDAEGWGGTIPAEGSDVSIDGANVVATYNGRDMPAWNSIEVKNGATLRIASDLALPKIILNKNAKLVIANSATVTLGNVADLTGVVATTPELVIPELVVEAGATLNVPGGMKFKNLNVRHFGTIAASSAGRLYFGYADANETAYFAMCSTNATISTINEGSYGGGTPCFVCPAANGLVQVYGTIELDGLTLTRVKTGSTSIYDAVMVGVNNPVSARVPNGRHGLHKGAGM